MKHYHIDNYFFDIENKTLYVRGWLFLRDCDIVIQIDNQEVLREKPNQYRYDICEEYSHKEDKNNYGFEYTITLENTYKKIQITAETSKKKYTLFKTIVPTTELEKKWAQFKLLVKKFFRLILRKNIQLLNPFLIRDYVMKARENKSYQEAKKYYINPNNSFQYRNWVQEKEAREVPIQRTFSYQPLISIIMPVYNVEISYLKACIDSVLAQTYPNFELCIADDCSTQKEIHTVLEEYKKKDQRIKVVYRKENGHISKASNSALLLATGEFIGLLDNDDVLIKDALEEVVAALNQNPKYDFLYSDQDKLDMDNHLCFPTYKPAWSKDLFLTHNYICHFTVIRKSQIDKVNGFRTGYEGAQDYDLFLRVISNIKEKNICHIPKVLYHWRMIIGSTAAVMSNKDYAFERGRKALEDYFKQEKIACKVLQVKDFPYYHPDYKYPKNTKITLIIDGSKQKSKKCIKKIQKYHGTIPIDFVFLEDENFHDLIKQAKGNVIVYLEEKVLLDKDSSLESLIQYARQKHVGIVSPTLDRKGSYQRTCGVVLMPDSYQPVIYSRRQASTFVEPRLIVPHNYIVPSTKILVFEKEKYLQIFKNNCFKTPFSSIDKIKLCMKFQQKGYFNLTDSSNIFTYDGEIIDDYDKEAYQKLKIEKDIYYNPNLSKKYLYQLDLIEKEDNDGSKDERTS